MALLVGKDSGYGDYKGFFRSKGFEQGFGFSYPAWVSAPVNLPDPDLSAVDVLDDLYMEYRGQNYWLGNKAQLTRNRTVNMDTNKLQTEEELVKLLAGLGYVTHITGGIKEFKIVTGIPVQQYNNFKNTLANGWKGTFRFNFRGESQEAKIVAVKPIAQGAGVYYDLCLGFDKVLDSDFFQKKVLIYDMGTRTTNLAPMSNGQYLGDMAHTIWTGVSNILMNLQEILLNKHGLTYDLTEITNVARDGHYLYKGQRFPIEQELRDASESVIDKIITESLVKIDLSRDIEAVVFASGGACIRAAAQLFEDKMRKYIFDARTVADPMANVRGYWKVGNYLELIDKF